MAKIAPQKLIIPQAKITYYVEILKLNFDQKSTMPQKARKKNVHTIHKVYTMNYFLRNKLIKKFLPFTQKIIADVFNIIFMLLGVDHKKCYGWWGSQELCTVGRKLHWWNGGS